MKLSFWQEGDNTSEFYSRFDGRVQNSTQAYREELLKKEPYELLDANGERKLVVPGFQSVDIEGDCDMPLFTSLKNVRDENGYKVSELKTWCENELTPLAWQRALVKTMPVMRNYGYDLDELQYPNHEMRISQGYFQLICITLGKLYNSRDSIA